MIDDFDAALILHFRHLTINFEGSLVRSSGGTIVSQQTMLIERVTSLKKCCEGRKFYIVARFVGAALEIIMNTD